MMIAPVEVATIQSNSSGTFFPVSCSSCSNTSISISPAHDSHDEYVYLHFHHCWGDFTFRPSRYPLFMMMSSGTFKIMDTLGPGIILSLVGRWSSLAKAAPPNVPEDVWNLKVYSLLRDLFIMSPIRGSAVFEAQTNQHEIITII